MHMKVLVEKEKPQRSKLEEFSRAPENAITRRPEPIRHWGALGEHMVHFSKYQLASSSWMEIRFSIDSNAISARPNMTTRALSAFARNRSNKTATGYFPEVNIEMVFCGWKQGDALPELSYENLQKINEAAKREVK